MKEYPYIGKGNQSGSCVLFFKGEAGIPLDGKGLLAIEGFVNLDFKERAFKDVTREHLEGKCVKIESVEHEKFVIKLAENCGFTYYSTSDSKECIMFWADGDWTYSSIHDTVEMINIPLPPKSAQVSTANRDIEREVWSKVGDEVILKSIGMTIHNKKVRLTYIGDGVGCYVDLTNGKEFTYAKRDTIFNKIKTEDEILRENLWDLVSESIEKESSIDSVVTDLLNNYNITKKPQ